MIDDLIKTLRELKRSNSRSGKLRSIKHDEVSRKRWEAVKGNLDHEAMHRERLMHQAHALAVDLGIAEPRDSYNKITLGDGWRQYEYQPPVPELVKR